MSATRPDRGSEGRRRGRLGAPAGFAMADYLDRWGRGARHDLSASDSETLTLAELLDLARPDDVERWQGLGFGYTQPHGAPWLRAAIADRHTELEADDVLCCAGAQEALSCVAAALLNPGDHAVIVLPIYHPSERAITSLCDATGVVLRAQAGGVQAGGAQDGGAQDGGSAGGGGWRLDPEAIESALRPNTRLVLMNFPNSPTGAAIDAATLDAVVALCRRRGLWLVNDEVYAQTATVPAAAPGLVADLYERGVSVNALSKSFGLPGLRVGWAACRDRTVLARALLAKSMLSSCLAASSEVLAHVALAAEGRIVGRTRAIGQRNLARLQTLFARLPEVFEAEVPDNLAFSFPRYRGADGATQFTRRLALEAGLLLLPASLWNSQLGEVPGERVRISLGHARCLPALVELEQRLGEEASAMATLPVDC